MKRRFILLSVFLGCVFSADLDARPGRSETAATAALSKASRAGAASVAPRRSIVNLQNRNWNRITVEARLGDNPNPEANRSLSSRSLRRGETWSIETRGEDVWYRRDANPDYPDGRFTAWVHRPCYPNRAKTYHEIL